MKRLVLLLVGCLFLWGCHLGARGPKPLTMDQLIVPPSGYSTEKGRALAIKYEETLENLFHNIRAKYRGKLGFATINPTHGGVTTGSIGFFKPFRGKESYYLGVKIGIDHFVYSTSQTDFSQRAATSFSRYAKDLLEIIMKEKRAVNDSDVEGAAERGNKASSFLREAGSLLRFLLRQGYGGQESYGG